MYRKFSHRYHRSKNILFVQKDLKKLFILVYSFNFDIQKLSVLRAKDIVHEKMKMDHVSR